MGLLAFLSPLDAKRCAASACALLVVPVLLSGCRSSPTAVELAAAPIHLQSSSSANAELDGRSRFRTIFCAIARRDGVVPPEDEACGGLLWLLSDESVSGEQARLPDLDRTLHLVIVTGALADCFGPDALPFREGASHLMGQGLRVDTIRVSGRSSAEHNARQIAAHLNQIEVDSGEQIVLLGYSKGAIDILQFLDAYPHLAARIAGVVSVAGPIFGSPLADQGAWAYDHLLSKAFVERCDPGDGGLVDSMVPAVRERWLKDHPLPEHVQYFSMAAFTTRERLARGLRPSWRLLARQDPRNDGQVLAVHTAIPGSMILGYANADHWGLAIEIERELPHLASRPAGTPFPQAALLEAMMRYVSERLDSRVVSP